MEDPKNNYFKMPNNYKDELCNIRISGEARQILDVIERLSMGWNQREAIISYRTFRKMTGLDNYHISRARAKLSKMRIIIVAKLGNKGELIYRIEMDYTKWRSLPKKARGKNVDASLPKKVTKTIAKLGNETISKIGNDQQAYIKDSIKDKNIKTEKNDYINNFSIEHLKTRKKDLEDDLKEKQGSFENLQYLTDAIKEIDHRIKSHPDSIHQSNPSLQKKSRSKRKKVCKQ